MNPINEEVLLELDRIADESLISVERHLVSGRSWISLNYFLGIPSILLAAGAGITAFFREQAYIAGITSLIVAVLTAVSTYLDPVKKGNAHNTSAKAYQSLHNDIRLVKIDCLDRSEQEWRVQLKILVEKFNQINENSPPLPKRSYRIADARVRGK